MEWNFPTIFVLCLIALALGAALFAVFKNRKKSCSCCDGNCSSCRQNKSK